MPECKFNQTPSLTPSLKELREELGGIQSLSAHEQMEASLLWKAFNCLKARNMRACLENLLHIREYGKYEVSIGLALYSMAKASNPWVKVQALQALTFCDFNFPPELLDSLRKVMHSLKEDEQKAVLGKAWESFGRNNFVSLVVDV
jgi:hypothetical protein